MTLIPGKIVFSCNSIKYGKCGGLLFLQAGLYSIGTQRAMGINGLTIGTDIPNDFGGLRSVSDCNAIHSRAYSYKLTSSTIAHNLQKHEYLGHTVNFKTRKHFKDKKSHYVDKDQWLIFEDTHRADYRPRNL